MSDWDFPEDDAEQGFYAACNVRRPFREKWVARMPYSALLMRWMTWSIRLLP
jgi:hypothetical protein